MVLPQFTGSFALDTSDLDSEVAHLYEHLLLNSIDVLSGDWRTHPLNVSDGGGHTHPDRIFIFFIVNTKEMYEKCLAVLNDSPAFSNQQIDAELSRCESEFRKSCARPINYPAIRREINRLQERTWIDMNNTNIKPTRDSNIKDYRDEILRYRCDAKSFRHITVVYGINDLSPADAAIFNRLKFLFDYIVEDNLRALGGYKTRSTSFIQTHGTPEHPKDISITIATLKRGTITSRGLTTRLQKSFSELNAPSFYPIVETVMKIFSHDPMYTLYASQTYAKTGIFASRIRTANEVTPEKLVELAAKITCRATPTRPHHWDMTE